MVEMPNYQPHHNPYRTRSYKHNAKSYKNAASDRGQPNNPIFVISAYHFMGKRNPWMNPGMHIESVEKAKKPLRVATYWSCPIKDEL
jgi:hypothetical protein